MKIIFHIDVNSAFLSWTAVARLKEDPHALDLRTVPSAIGGDVTKRHGIITAKSIPAKKYGITTGEPVVKALAKCPQLVLAPGDFQLYRQCSRAFMDLVKAYGTCEQVSIDETFVDVSELVGAGARKIMQDQARESNRGREDLESYMKEYAPVLADQIREEIYEKLGFTVNVGISTNKFLAKMASDFSKPNQTHTLYLEEIEEKMWPLPVVELFGCGKKTAKRLEEAGYHTIGDLANTDYKALSMHFGENTAHYLYESAHGRGSDTVSDDYDDPKSYSNETTTLVDITLENYDELMPVILRELSESVSRRMVRDSIYAHTVSVSVKTGEFRRHSRQMTLDVLLQSADDLFHYATLLMEELSRSSTGLLTKGQVYRLIGVGCANLDDGSYQQMDLFSWANEQFP